MVKLNRIYTRSGDDGTTGLGDGTRVTKTSARIEAYGTVDELNAVVGLCLVHAGEEAPWSWLRRVQNDLFDLGADLAVPLAPDEAGRLRVGAARVTRVERWIDEANADLPELTSFVLPGGTPLAAGLHLARTVCRRAERRVLALGETEPINREVPRFLNRLSDLLFVLARRAAGPHEVLWVPAGDEPPTAGGDGP